MVGKYYFIKLGKGAGVKRGKLCLRESGRVGERLFIRLTNGIEAEVSEKIDVSEIRVYIYTATTCL